MHIRNFMRQWLQGVFISFLLSICHFSWAQVKPDGDEMNMDERLAEVLKEILISIDADPFILTDMVDFETAEYFREVVAVKSTQVANKIKKEKANQRSLARWTAGVGS